MKILAVLVLFLLVGAGFMGLGWWSPPSGGPSAAVSLDAGSNTSEVDDPPADLTSPSAADPSRERHRRLKKLTERGDAESYQALVDAYSEWAGQRDAIVDRSKIVGLLSRMDDPVDAFEHLLVAVGKDSTPLEDDPLWRLVASEMSALWDDGRVRQQGRQLLHLTRNPKALRVLTRSLALYGGSSSATELSEHERAGLAGDLIDLYFAREDAELRTEASAGIGALGGDEVASALTEPLERDEPENEERMRAEAAEIVPEIREHVAELLEGIRRPTVTVAEFKEAVDSIKILSPRTLHQLRKSPLIDESPVARDYLEKAIRSVGH